MVSLYRYNFPYIAYHFSNIYIFLASHIIFNIFRFQKLCLLFLPGVPVFPPFGRPQNPAVRFFFHVALQCGAKRCAAISTPICPAAGFSARLCFQSMQATALAILEAYVCPDSFAAIFLRVKTKNRPAWMYHAERFLFHI